MVPLLSLSARGAFHASRHRELAPEANMTAPRHRFDSSRHLRASREFARVKTEAATFRGQHCLLLALAHPGEPTRVGFIASRKGVGGAVERNRARRRLREILRVRWPRVPHTGYWLVLIAHRSSLTAAHQDLADDVERVLAAAGALAPIPRNPEIPE